MDIVKQMKQRSSVRDFIVGEEIPEEHQRQIVQAAQMSSTSFNLQTYSIISVECPNKRHRIAELSGRQWFICDASLFWVFCVDLYKMAYVTGRAGYAYYQSRYFESTLMAVIDTALAAQTAAITAEAMGYGICMIGGVRNHVDQVMELLALPDKVFPMVGLCIGHVRRRNPPKRRLSTGGVFFRDAYAPEEVEYAIDDYSRAMAESGIYTGREFPAKEVDVERETADDAYGWIHHSGRRVSTRDVEKARTALKQILSQRGFGFE